MTRLQQIKSFFIPTNASAITDSLSGVTVALALIPEAIAFALVAGVSPFIGLYAAFFMCLITAVIGGRPGMISGATGSMAVVMISLVSQHSNGIELLFATVVFTGLLQILVGYLKLGKLMRMMPKPVMVGFVNGLAIVIALAQLEQFKMAGADGVMHWLQGQALFVMIGLVLIAMFITHFLPRITKAVPSALTAIIVVTLIVLGAEHYGMHINVVNDMMKGATQSGFPSFHIPNIAFTWETLKIITPYAVILTIIGLSESLMTLALIDERTKTRGQDNKECVGQGIANIVSGFFQSMGGCAMIGQSMINITSGGRGRLSGIVAGVCLLVFILIAWPMIKLIPLAALAGVMFMVVIETFEWATFEFIRKIPIQDALIIVTVTIVTVVSDLAIAVVVGIVVASLVFAWETSKKVYTEERINEKGQKEHLVYGPIFFASIRQFKSLFDVDADPIDVIIDFKHSHISDHSAIDAIMSLAEEYALQGKRLQLRHLSEKCKLILGKAGTLEFIEVVKA